MSSPPRILLFGARGQVGWELARALAPVGHVVAPVRERDAADFRVPDGLRAIVREIAPDVLAAAEQVGR